MDGCEVYLEAISESVDGLLEEPRQHELDAHLAVCPACRACFDAFSAQKSVMDHWEETPPDTLLPGILYKIDLEQRQLRHPMRRRFGALASVAAAIVILVAVLPSVISPSSKDLSGADSGGGFAMRDSLVERTTFGNNMAPESAMIYGDAPAEGSMTASEKDGDLGMSFQTDVVGTPDAFLTSENAPVNTVYMVATEVPSVLSSYTLTDTDACYEVVVPRSDFETIWPLLQEMGASQTGRGAESPSGATLQPMATTPPDATPFQDTADGVESLADTVLIVIYKE